MCPGFLGRSFRGRSCLAALRMSKARNWVWSASFSPPSSCRSALSLARIASGGPGGRHGLCDHVTAAVLLVGVTCPRPFVSSPSIRATTVGAVDLQTCCRLVLGLGLVCLER
jgi:hypothetical protein